MNAPTPRGNSPVSLECGEFPVLARLASVDETMTDDRGATDRREISLRVRHLGLRVLGQSLRLDLYRLVCYFQTSEYLASLADSLDFCPWIGMRDEFQDQEIMRILLQTAVAVRFIGGGHADAHRVDREWIEEPVGILYKAVNQIETVPLSLREACNKLIHSKNIVLDTNDEGGHYERFIKPTTISCYEDFQQQNGWKAQIELLPFVENADSLFQLY